MPKEYANIYQGEMVFGKTDDDGYFAGQVADPNTITPGVVSGGYVIEGIDFTPAVKTNPEVTIAGAQEILGVMPLPASSFGQPGFNNPYEHDEFVASLINNSLIDGTTSTEAEIMALNVLQDTFVRSMAVMQVRYQDIATGDVGFRNYNFLNGRMIETTPAGAGLVSGDVTNPNPFAYGIKLEVATRDITGRLLSSMPLGINKGKDVATKWSSSGRRYPVRIEGDGVETDFTLPFLPLVEDLTGEAEIAVNVDGVLQALASASITTGLVTFTVAPALNAKIIVYYTTAYVLSP